MTPTLVILAAGASRRMGRCKALVEIEGEPALRRLFAAATGPSGPAADDGFAGQPLIVTGADHDEIRDALGAELQGRAQLLHHAGWERGRTSSIQAAVRARPGEDLLLAPVDHPLVPRQVFEALRRAWAEARAPAFGWLAPRVDRPGRPPAYGHPVLLGRALLARLAGSPADRPLRELRQSASPLLSVPADPRVLANLDRPGDLEEFSDREN